jgi:xanthine/CO dehydrogenase XdhC/CoxF family maturation factor
MNTIQPIVDLAEQLPAGMPVAIATVVNVRGSTYRRPGARLLVTSDGRSAGMISGGCFETDARERCRRVMSTGRPEIVTYDSTSPDDIVFGLGLGCQGVVQVLFEKLVAGDTAGLLSFFAACAARRQSGRVATVFEAKEIPLGGRVLRWPDGRVTSSLADPAFSSGLTHAFREIGPQLVAVEELELCNARTATVLVETIVPSPSLTIFGGGDDAIPVVRIAKLVGWHVAVVDARPDYAKRERFPAADNVLCLRPEAVATDPGIVLPPESLVVVMTHNFTHDQALLRTLLTRPLRYLGILGPKARTARLLDELANGGVIPSVEKLAHLYAPAGLDLGAETPEEIAVSMMGEMQAVLACRRGGSLRDRNAPIHDNPADYGRLHGTVGRHSDADSV